MTNLPNNRFFLSTLIGCLSMVFVVSCTSSKQLSDASATSSKKIIRKKHTAPNPNEMEPNKKYPTNLTLADMLRKVPGLAVSGTGTRVSVRVRGMNSVNASNEPLYILNGVPQGHEYALVASMVNPREIDRIEVVKGSDTATYGSRGANGVILIKMK